MLTRSPQADVRPDFAHHLTSRSNLRANLSNNSFATATDRGVYQGNTVTFRSSGTLSKRDPVDYYKFQITQGANCSKILDIFMIRLGGLRVVGYVDAGDGITKLSQDRYSKGKVRQVSPGFSNFSVNATFYLKYDRLNSKGTTRYESKSTFFS